MGFRVSHQPSYIYQSPSGYIFRIRVPQELREQIGKTEFRYSLRTGALRIAKHRARSIASFIHQMFLKVRQGFTENVKELNRQIKDYIKEVIQADQRRREAPEPASIAAELSASPETQSGPVAEIFKALRDELHKVLEHVAGATMMRPQGNPSLSHEECLEPMKCQQPKASPVSTQEEPEVPSVVTFTEVQQMYEAEMEIGGNWTEKTKAENKTIFALLVRVLGDLPISKYDRKLMSQYKGTLMKLPPNLNMLPQYKGKTIEQVLASKPSKTLSVNSINKHIRWLSGLFNHAVKNGYLPSNPAEGLLIKNMRRPDQEREIYTQEDLQKIFGSEEYVNNTHKHSFGFWTPLIALYSGCRLEEICQLHLDDIRQEGGVWIFDINDKEEKRLKNRSSIRIVPIHPKLIEFGILDRVQRLKARGEKRFFPKLHQLRDGYGQVVSKWYQRFKQKCGIDKNKNFHSFRHTFITHLKHKQVDPFMIHELDGHAIDSETMGRYGKRYTPDILLREAIEKIDFGLNLTEIDKF